MREEMIKVSPFEFLDYMEIEGVQQISEHGYLKIVGHIKAEREDSYLNLMMGEVWVEVNAFTYKQKREAIFCGTIKEANIEKINGVCILTLVLVTGSYLMDHKSHIRTFQNQGFTYGSVMDMVMAEYANGGIIPASGSGKNIPGLIVQYNETDWAFGKRMASHLNTVMVAESVVKGEKIYFGIPDLAVKTSVQTKEYSLKRVKDGTVYFVWETREIHRILEIIQFNGMPLCITKIETRLLGNELYYSYFLTQKNNIKTEKQYNHSVIGASLSGSVAAVTKDVVQVTLAEDENAGKAGKQWFPYATVYSSPDGTGWYCMPENGDQVRLCIPSQDETEAYVASSTHLQSSVGDERVNPDNKSIMNKQGKEILFTPNSLLITNNDGMSIELDDEEGIKIISDKSISMEAEEAIELTSTNSKLELYAKDNLNLQQGNTQMQMEGDMRMYGAKLNLN